MVRIIKFIRGDLIMRRIAPINLIIHIPKTTEGKAELAQRVASVHSDAVTQRLKYMPCPTSQKMALLEAIIKTAKQREQACPAHGEQPQSIRDYLQFESSPLCNG